jgi:divalent metal cation (Fe/Co/Zn/Cd) transporter
MTEPSQLRATRRTVLTAGAANVVVAALKLAAGLLAGSSAMLAESAHSVADTVNQGLLLNSLRLGERPGDRRHPFGYGQDRYFWSPLAYVVLGISFVAEGTSLTGAVRQTRAQATRRRTTILRHVSDSPDTSVKAAQRRHVCSRSPRQMTCDAT